MAPDLRRWAELLLAREKEPVKETGTALRSGAAGEQILELEWRLGCRLPASYRDFPAPSAAEAGAAIAAPARSESECLRRLAETWS